MAEWFAAGFEEAAVVYWLYNMAVRAARNGRLLLHMNKEGVYAVIV